MLFQRAVEVAVAGVGYFLKVGDESAVDFFVSALLVVDLEKLNVVDR